jgi:hypothetical protein
MAARRVFYADAMLRKLARWLRLLGYETRYAASSWGDDRVLREARRARAVLLTRDRALYHRTRGRPGAVLFNTTDTFRQLRELFARYRLSARGFLARTRCPECGTLIKIARKSEVKGLIHPAVHAAHRRFWRCPGCGKVYWRGAHWKKISREVARLTRGAAPRRSRRPSASARRPRPARA